jgi:hypothetical protein
MMRHLAGHVGVAAVVFVFALPACARSSADTSNPVGAHVPIPASGPAGIHSRQAPRNLASSENERPPAGEAVSPDAPSVVPAPSTSLPVLRIWYGPTEEPPEPLLGALAEQDDPDPDVRLRALDTWARRPGESLDPVTHALVDPDESVRARAQELFETELEGR